MVDDATAARWGIQHRYTDGSGQERVAPDHVVDRVADELRRGGEAVDPAPNERITFVRLGETGLPASVQGRRLITEDGADGGVMAELPADLGIGYHWLVDDDDGRQTQLVVHPEGCHLNDDLRAWGWALQLHADRSESSWGIGDLADARTVGRWSKQWGAHPVLLLNPLHAPNLGDHPEASPYFASTRCFRNPLALRIEEVGGFDPLDRDLLDLADRGRALNADRLINRDAVWSIKRRALDFIWAGPSHDRWRWSVEADLDRDPVARSFAAFTVAVEQLGEPWTRWPADLQRPDGLGWREFTVRHADRIAFHTWLQNEVLAQVSSLEAVLPVLHDLAIGTDRAGFDAWYWQDMFVLDGTRIGAPSDQFNTLGQDWGLPPLDPHRLRAGCYEPFIRMLRCAFAAGSGLRIDHVMGLFRLFWILPGETPAEGVYVRQPSDELLALVALESTRAGAFVVGEDLGTVEAGVREQLAAHRFLSYRVMSLDDTPVDHFPRDSLASVSTHDLPTIAGFWTGTDLADQERLGMNPPIDDTVQARDSFGRLVDVAPDAPMESVVVAAHRTLGRAGSRVVLGQLEDAALVAERPNMPGTTTQWPNWSLALPDPIEQLLATETAEAVADAMAAGSEGSPR